VSAIPVWGLPVLIFIAEMAVVTLGTLRIIFISRGQKALAPLLGFFEILLWLFAISQIMQNLDKVPCFLAFAFGFTAGNFLGIVIEKSLAMGHAVVRVITHRDPAELIAALRDAQCGVTCIEGHGATGKVQIVMTVIQRKRLAQVVALIEEHHPQAFYAIDELQAASDGIFAPKRERPGLVPTGFKEMLAMKH
jgi:uncharacterized protein YebE (UPF0316 family)